MIAALTVARQPQGPKSPRNRSIRARARSRRPTHRAARARAIAALRANGVDIARTPSEALADFVESCAPAPDPNADPALKPRGRYSKRNKHHAWMLRRE